MSHKRCDMLGVVAITGLLAGLSLTSGSNQDFVLYAGLAALGAYAYVSFEVLPKRRVQKAPKQTAVVYKEVLPPPIPVESRNGHAVPIERVRPAQLRVAV